MGLFSGIGSFFGPVGSILGGLGDEILGRDDARETNSAMLNSQRTLRQTAYQDTTKDLQAAGLNPMLAYSNGPTASATPNLQNKGAMSAQQNSAQATTANLNADTKLKVAQAALTSAQEAKTLDERLAIPQNMALQASTVEKQTQEIANMRQDISLILSKDKLTSNQALESSTRAALNMANQELTNVQKRVQEGVITLNQAQQAVQEITKRLKDLEIPGAENLANYEKMFGSEAGNIPKAIGGIANTARKVLGK